MKRIKTFLKSWSKLEIILLIIGIAAISSVSCILKSNAISTSYSLFSITKALCSAKGSIIGPILNIGLVITYSITAFKTGYYGEIISQSISFVFGVLTIITWFKHLGKEQVVTKNYLRKKEKIVLVFLAFLLVPAIYFMLKSFNTQELILSTINMTLNLYAMYLRMRRSSIQFVFYILLNIVSVVLWIIAATKDPTSWIMIISPSINGVVCAYGFYKWTRT